MTGKPQALAREQGAPLYHQIYLILRDAIGSGRYQTGELLPTEDAFAGEFGVSRITVRRALDMLARGGLIERRQGRGTFVTLPAGSTGAMTMTSVTDQIIRVGETTEVRVVEFGRAVPPAEVAEIFGIPPGGRLQRAVRVRLRDGEPIFHLTTFVSDPVAKTFDRADMERMPLFELIHRAGVSLADGTQMVTATLAEPVAAQRLAVKIGAPLLRVVRVLNDAQGRPVEHLDMLCSPERYQLRYALQRDDIRAIHGRMGGGRIMAEAPA